MGTFGKSGGRRLRVKPERAGLEGARREQGILVLFLDNFSTLKALAAWIFFVCFVIQTD